MDELTIGAKTYISSKRAAAITGYAKDYVGQLCREGRVEARLVGRSWYVLESSIRAHRFGSEQSTSGRLEATKNAKQKPESGESAQYWETSTYTAETVSKLPEIEKGFNLLDKSAPVSKESDPVEEMQSAWSEWFDRRSELSPAEPPIAIDESEPFIEDPQEAEIAHQEVEIRREGEYRGEEQEEKEQRVTHAPIAAPIMHDIEPAVRIHREIEPPAAAKPHHDVPVESRRGIRREKQQPRRSNLILRTAVLAVTGLIVAITFLGTGLADPYLTVSGPHESFLKLLGGERTYIKSL